VINDKSPRHVAMRYIIIIINILTWPK